MSISKLLALLVFPALGAAQTGNVRLTWVGQACFVIESEGGPVVLTDPPGASVGYALPGQAADVVTVSHNHGDHNNTGGVRGTFALVDGRDLTERRQMTAAGIDFTLIPGFHDNQNGAARGRNTIVRWTQGGLQFAHLGDFGQDAFTDAQAADLHDIDVLFVPAGGFFTLEPERAAAVVKPLGARVTILMHFRTALGGPQQLATFPAAAAGFDPLRFKPATLTLSRASLPAAPEVWLMVPAADAAMVNAASFAPGLPLAPGSLASLFGNFAGVQRASATGLPLPRKLADAEVMVGGNAAPLLFASPNQINLQVPSQATPGQPLVEVRVGGQPVARGSATVVSSAPGVFGVLNEDSRPNSPANPARRGQVLQIFATGQGAASPAVDDGAAPPDQVLSTTPQPPQVLLDGKPIPVEFSGLAPRFPGVWQVNARIPQDAAAGNGVSLTVNYGMTSNAVTVAIQ